MTLDKSTKYRVVKVSFWDDEYTEDLEPKEKLLYVYFLTNPLTNISGVYEITPKRIVYNTSLSRDEVKSFMIKFQNDKKIAYIGNFVVVKNWVKHQAINPQIVTGIHNYISNIDIRILVDAYELFEIEWKEPDYLKDPTWGYSIVENMAYDGLKKKKRCLLLGDIYPDKIRREPLVVQTTEIVTVPQENEEIIKITSTPVVVEDYIDSIVELFAKEYQSAKNQEYIISPKDRKAVGKLLSLIKSRNPAYDSDQTKQAFRTLFKQTCKLNKNDFYNTITLSKLSAYINEYMLLVKSNNPIDLNKYDTIKTILSNAKV